MQLFSMLAKLVEFVKAFSHYHQFHDKKVCVVCSEMFNTFANTKDRTSKYFDFFSSRTVCDDCRCNLEYDGEPTDLIVYSREGTRYFQHKRKKCKNR